MSLGWKRVNDMVEVITSPVSSAAGDLWEVRVLPCQYLTWKCWFWLWVKAPDRLVVGRCGLEACILLLQILLLFPLYGSFPLMPDFLILILLVVTRITNKAPRSIFLEMKGLLSLLYHVFPTRAMMETVLNPANLWGRRPSSNRDKQDIIGSVGQNTELWSA